MLGTFPNGARGWGLGTITGLVPMTQPHKSGDRFQSPGEVLDQVLVGMFRKAQSSLCSLPPPKKETASLPSKALGRRKEDAKEKPKGASVSTHKQKPDSDRQLDLGVPHGVGSPFSPPSNHPFEPAFSSFPAAFASVRLRHT